VPDFIICGNTENAALGIFRQLRYKPTLWVALKNTRLPNLISNFGSIPEVPLTPGGSFAGCRDRGGVASNRPPQRIQLRLALRFLEKIPVNWMTNRSAVRWKGVPEDEITIASKPLPYPSL
jgi:hypothetical protein